MIQFLVMAVIVVVFVFILTLILSLMIWVVSRLLRFLFPQRFGAAVKAVQEKTGKKKLTQLKGERMEDRCTECKQFNICPAAMAMPYPCRKFDQAEAAS